MPKGNKSHKLLNKRTQFFFSIFVKKALLSWLSFCKLIISHFLYLQESKIYNNKWESKKYCAKNNPSCSFNGYFGPLKQGDPR